MFRKLVLASTIILLALHAHAETVTEYAQTCIDAVEIDTIPGFTCDQDGASVELKDDNPAFLGKLKVSNPDVDAVFLCRKIGLPGSDGLVALIIHNRSNKNTCFFDAKTTPSNNTAVSPLAGANAVSYWQTPADMENSSVSRCHECHATDAFLATEYVVDELSNLGLLGNGRDLINDNDLNNPINTAAPYNIVGSTFAHWNGEFETMIDCAGSCHRIATNSTFYDTYVTDMITKNYMSTSSNHVRWNKSPTAFYEDAEDDHLFFKNGGDAPWRLRSGTTPTGASHATGPHNAFDGASYLYVETSPNQGLFQANRKAVLESGLFDADDTFLTFAYHVYGIDAGVLSLEVYTDGQWQLYGSVNGQNSADNNPNWQVAFISLDTYKSNGPIRIRFTVTTHGGFRGDIALDEIRITR